MPAPTALLRQSDQIAQQEAVSFPQEGGGDVIIDMIDGAPTEDARTSGAPTSNTQNHAQLRFDEDSKPKFAPARVEQGGHVVEGRKVSVPPHRLSPLKTAWPDMLPPLVEHLKLQVRMNVKSRSVELRTSAGTIDAGALQKGEDFVRAFTLGFDVSDAVALLRLDDLYIETFEIKDVKSLSGDHLGRAIGRISGKDGKTKFAIENASRTRIVLADQKIHILGGFRNIRIAREAIVSLILGSPPGKVYGNLRTVASRMKERF